MKLNLFYAEPDPDRWLPGDRYPRRVIRRLVRGPERVGGQKRVFLNLCAGLDRLGIGYRVNDFSWLKKNPGELAGVIGKSFLLEEFRHGQNPILFGAAVFSHPSDDPQLFERLPVKKILVPGEWMRRMFAETWGDRVQAWPVGIDTERWKPGGKKEIDILLYNKIRWDHAQMEREILEPIRATLTRQGLSWKEIRYGHYEETDYEKLLAKACAMVFICEHETQGIAYQQALAAGVPILAWSGRHWWTDPSYYPDKVKFAPVSAVPYWDRRCGLIFQGATEFPELLKEFWIKRDTYDPRAYILENLTLEKAAQAYAEIYRGLS